MDVYGSKAEDRVVILRLLGSDRFGYSFKQ